MQEKKHKFGVVIAKLEEMYSQLRRRHLAIEENPIEISHFYSTRDWNNNFLMNGNIIIKQV